MLYLGAPRVRMAGEWWGGGPRKVEYCQISRTGSSGGGSNIIVVLIAVVVVVVVVVLILRSTRSSN